MSEPSFKLFARAAFALFAGPGLVAACSETAQVPAPPVPFDRASYSFREGERPIYDRTIAVKDLNGFRLAGGVVLDVRLAEDFAADPSTISGSERRDPDAIAEWASEYAPGRPVALYCVKGKWVSQKAAAFLAERGVEAYSVEGGLEAWKLLESPR